MTIGEKIEFLRTSKKITVVKLAELAGINSVLLRKYETNLTTPKSNQIKKIATALNISPYALTSENNYFEVNTVGDLYGVIIYLYKTKFIDFNISPTSDNIDIKFSDLIIPLIDLKNHETGKTEIVNQNSYTISLIQKLKEKPSYDKFYKLVIGYDKLRKAEKNSSINVDELKEETEILELELQQSTELLKDLQ